MVGEVEYDYSRFFDDVEYCSGWVEGSPTSGKSCSQAPDPTFTDAASCEAWCQSGGFPSAPTAAPTSTPAPAPTQSCTGQYFGKSQCEWANKDKTGGSCQLNPELGDITPGNSNYWKWSWCKDSNTPSKPNSSVEITPTPLPTSKPKVTPTLKPTVTPKPTPLPTSTPVPTPEPTVVIPTPTVNTNNDNNNSCPSSCSVKETRQEAIKTYCEDKGYTCDNGTWADLTCYGGMKDGWCQWTQSGESCSDPYCTGCECIIKDEPTPLPTSVPSPEPTPYRISPMGFGGAETCKASDNIYPGSTFYTGGQSTCGGYNWRNTNEKCFYQNFSGQIVEGVFYDVFSCECDVDYEIWNNNQLNVASWIYNYKNSYSTQTLSQQCLPKGYVGNYNEKWTDSACNDWCKTALTQPESNTSSTSPIEPTPTVQPAPPVRSVPVTDTISDIISRVIPKPKTEKTDTPVNYENETRIGSLCTVGQWNPKTCSRCSEYGTWNPSFTDFGDGTNKNEWCYCCLTALGASHPDCGECTTLKALTEIF